MRLLILPFLFSSFSLFAQAPFNYSQQIIWKSDSSLELSFQSTNFQNEKLVTLKIVNNLEGFQQFQQSFDSVFVGKGISIFRREFIFSSKGCNPYEDSLMFTLNILDLKDKSKIGNGQCLVLPKKMKWSNISLTDSSIMIPFKSENTTYSISSSHKLDSLPENQLFTLTKDSTIRWDSLITRDPFEQRKFEIIQRNNSNQTELTKVWYKNGKFLKRQPVTLRLDSAANSTIKSIQLSGNASMESNFFSKTPQHSNGAQYPFSSFQANTTISIYGIPFILNGSHSTNDNISPNFRNFFSLQFDSDGFKNNMEKQLNEKLEENQFTPAKLKDQLNKNEASLEKLRRFEKIAQTFNIDDVELDSLLSNEFQQVQKSVKVDSILNLDTLNNEANVTVDSISAMQKVSKLDSLKNESNNSLTKIQTAIAQLERSNELQKKHLAKLKENGTLPPIQQLDRNELFSKFQSGSLNSILLRFNKLDIGNFYEYTGEYSIRDVELQGVNLSFLINKTNSISMLHGKLNDFQSFNLDEIKDRKNISSFGWSNSKYSYLKPTLRVTRISDQTINSEISNTTKNYYVTSLNAEGEISSWANYILEYNTSSTDINPITASNGQEGRNRAIFLKTYFTPLPFFDVKLQFDRIGSNYRSDGVYFLNRNFQAYTIGGKIRLFKNKIHIKNDFTIQERNFEQKELTNRTQKQFYDVGTHFKRLPNLQVSYSPIFIEVANRIDTSFSGINANTNVLIARLFYFKKIKKTLITTAFVYNQIENELADDLSTQKGIQHFASISNEKTNFSFTSSYDEDFGSVRFISTSLGQKVGKKLQFNTHLAKNFRNDFYSEIVRTGLNWQLSNRFNLGAGGIFLIENSSGTVNSGGSVSLRVNY